MKQAVVVSAFCLVVASPPAGAQVVVTWDHTHDAPPGENDFVNDVAVDASGNVYVTGRSGDTQLPGFPPPLPTQSIETVKYDAAGNFQWRARYHSPLGGDDVGNAIAVAPSGAVIVVGRSNYFSRQTVVKYDANGAELWAFQYGAAGSNEGRAVLVDSNGDIFVGGQDGGSSGTGDMCVRKLDPNGAIVWTATYNGIANGFDFAYAIALAPNGDIVAAGNTNGSTDLALMRVSPSGTVLWAREVGASANGSENAFSVAVDSAGTAYAAGQLTTGSTGTDQALVAYDSAGNHLWTRTRDGSAHAADAFLKVAIDPLGRAIAAGRLTETGAGANFSVVMYTPAGTIAWSREWGGAANLDELPRGLVLDSLGNVYVAGSSPLSSTIFEGRVIAYDANGADLFNLPYGNAMTSDRFIDIERGPGASLLVGGYHDNGGFNVVDYLTLRLDPLAISFCAGDGSGTACPCGNNGSGGSGCANSSLSSGAWLSTSGTPGASATTDTLVLTANAVPGPGLFFQGTGQQGAGAGLQFGDGLLCAGGAITRMGVVFPTGTSASYPGGLTPNPIHVAGGTVNGDVRHYQCWYRDAIAYCTPSTFNLTQGLTITWGP